MVGELFALLAAVAFALSTVFSRRYMAPLVPDPRRPPVPPDLGVFATMVANAVLYVGLLLVEAARGTLPPLTPAALGLFVLGGLCGTFIGRNLAFLSVHRIGPARSTALRLSNTLFAALIGLVALRELPRPWQIVGAALLTTGLWLVIRSHTRAEAPARDGWGVVAALASAVAFALGDTARRGGLVLAPSPVLGAAIGVVVPLLVQSLWLLRTRPARPPVRGLLRFDVVAGALAHTAAILLLFFALQRTAVANAAVLYNLQVLLVILFGRWLLPGDEETPPALVVGSVLALLGTAAVLFG
ncbi:MAG: EamA family transporter [Armatimonadota bacterium]|nr:EamA family transporter [Armatimonadota bacterium]MDR7448752.1 EamA family transporter [Armatimonadota bacterium]MDR7479090.1 EamA family transporter [Armatimonadota bacterium]MDR7489752.1 EamA family transporter [Armatimonadota bacterium]MDR7491116.1 EamA family transporter [Armatimonadota bacterium]